MNIRAAIAFTPTGGLPIGGYSANNTTQLNLGTVPANGIGTFKPIAAITYKYNYNSNNLPVDCEVNNNPGFPMKMKFYYTN